MSLLLLDTDVALEAIAANTLFPPHTPVAADDAAARFLALARGALEIGEALGFQADAIHCHDWHAGLPERNAGFR